MSSQTIITAIVKRELKSYFSSPLGYVFIIIFLFAMGHVTFEPGRGSFFLSRQADLRAFFRYIPWIFLLLVSAVTMRSWAEERKSGTIEMLLTLPITVWQAIIGKFLASWIFVTLALALTFPMVLTVVYLGNPDLSVIFIGYVGSVLLAGSYLSVGLFFSSLTKNQVTSFILTVVVCYILLMAGSPPVLGFLSVFMPKFFVDIFESLSLLNHFESLQRGVINLGDIFFYLMMIVGWLYGHYLVLNEKKAN